MSNPPEAAPERPTERWQALGMLLIANFFWGLSFPLIKAALLVQQRLQPEATGIFVTALTVAPRFVLGGAALLLWRGPAAARGRLTARERRQGLILGGFAAAGMLLQNDGLRFTAASTSAFLTQFYALLIPLWVAARGRRLPTLATIASCLLVLTGTAVLGRLRWHHLHLGRGEWETLLASCFFMGQILCLENPAFTGNRPAAITRVMFATEAVLFAALACFTAPGVGALALPWTSGAWVGLTLILTAFCTVGAFSLMNAWQPRITATEAGLIYCVEPIFGSLLALVLPAWCSRWAQISYPNEQATAHLLIGGGLITAANVIIQLWRPPA